MPSSAGNSVAKRVARRVARRNEMRAQAGTPVMWLLKHVRRLTRPVSAKVGLAIVGSWLLLSVVGPLTFWTVDPNLPVGERLAPPTADHPLGTDQFGRDVLARILHGGRISLTVGVMAVGLSTLLGSIIGLISGYFGGSIDVLLMRLIEVLLAFPIVLLALSIVTILGPNMVNLMVAVGIGATPQYARLVRGSVLSAKENTYVEAARSIGGSHVHIMFWHILRNVSASIVVLASLNAADAIVVAAGLSFLGLGIQPPTADWGGMLSDARSLMRLAWWSMAFPGAALVSVTLGLNLLGDGLRQTLDPRLRSM